MFSLFFGIFDFVGDPSTPSCTFNPCTTATDFPGCNRDNLYLSRVTAPAGTRRVIYCRVKKWRRKGQGGKIKEGRSRRKGQGGKVKEERLGSKSRREKVGEENSRRRGRKEKDREGDNCKKKKPFAPYQRSKRKGQGGK